MRKFEGTTVLLAAKLSTMTFLEAAEQLLSLDCWAEKEKGLVRQSSQGFPNQLSEFWWGVALGM